MSTYHVKSQKIMEYFLYQTLKTEQSDESVLGNLHSSLDDINILSEIVQYLPKNTIKVLLVGEINTGKSSFVNKLVKDKIYNFYCATQYPNHTFYTYKDFEFEFIELPGLVYQLNEDTYDHYYKEVDYIFKFMQLNRLTFQFTCAWISRVSKLLKPNIKIKSIIVQDYEDQYLTKKLHRISIKKNTGIYELLDYVIELLT